MTLARTARRTLGAAVALLLLPLGAQAVASYDPIASGSTAITLSSSFVRVLAEHHVRLEPQGGAKKSGRTIVIPATAGEADPRLGTGTVEGGGSILFSVGSHRVPFRAIAFKAKRSPLYAKVGGSQLKIATGARLTSKRTGFGVGFEADGLRLTSKVATRLNKKLRIGKAFSGGQLIGRVTVTTRPLTVHLLEDRRLTLALDPTFFAKLNKLFVSLNPIAPAELGPGPALSFPVGSESTLAPDGRSGIVKLAGSIELLQLGSAQVFWREVWLEPSADSLSAEVDVEPSPPHPGKQPQAGLLALPPGAAVDSDPATRTIAITGQGAVLSDAAAAALNAAFAQGASEFAGGEPVGMVSLSVRAE